MALPNLCRRVSKEEVSFSSKALKSQHLTNPFFAIYDNAFLDVLGPNPNITLAAQQDWPFAHEAGVYIPSQDAVYITSNRHQPQGSSDQTIKISKVSRQSDGKWRHEIIGLEHLMGNGGVNHEGGVLLCAQGSKTELGGLVHMDVEPPYSTKTLIDGFHGRTFSSVNDVVLHTDGSIWFTDPIYGYEQGFRPKPQLPCQVYRLEPESGDIRVVADGFGRPNGLCFSPDEKTMYITDTDLIHGDGTVDLTRAGTIYAFDVIERHGSQFLANKRLFAFADSGIPDGIKCDLEGNVYSGCDDGVNIWTAGGRLIGKIMIPGGVANFCFGATQTKKGEMVLLNETRLWVVTIDEHRQGALLANMSIAV